MKLSEAICSVMKKHIEEYDGLIMGETLSSIGNTYGTIPDINTSNIIELPMSDVAAGGFATGAALVGRRVVFVLRFQDFFMLNCSSILQDAAISKEFHGTDCPVFVRAIFSEKAGPNHSNSLHSIAMHFPGIMVCAPMTAKEYEEAYERYINENNPIFVSEDRRALSLEFDSNDKKVINSDITLFGIGDARLELEKVSKRLESEGYKVSISNIVWLKPFDIEYYADFLKNSGCGLVIDSDREICGASEHIAYLLMKKTRKNVWALGSDDHVKTLRRDEYHEAPKEDVIYNMAKSLLQEY